MTALVEAAKAPDFPGEIALVLSNNPDAGGLEFARNQDIKTAVVDHTGFNSREAFEQGLQNVLESEQIELVALAGFMRKLTAGFTKKWENRMINIHPSLLPKFKGLHTHERAIEAGEIPDQPYQELLPRLFWDYQSGVLAYWLKDDSDNFANTTLFVDKSMEIVANLLHQGLVGKSLDLISFLFRTHVMSHFDNFNNDSQASSTDKKAKRRFMGADNAS